MCTDVRGLLAISLRDGFLINLNTIDIKGQSIGRTIVKGRDHVPPYSRRKVAAALRQSILTAETRVEFRATDKKYVARGTDNIARCGRGAVIQHPCLFGET